MAYVPKTWVNGETADASEMNHMEQGIAAADAAATLASKTAQKNSDIQDYQLKAAQYSSLTVNIGYTTSSANNGALTPNTKRAATEKLSVSAIHVFGIIGSTYQFKIAAYDANDDYLGGFPSDEWSSYDVVVPKDAVKVRILIKRTDDAVISSNESTVIKNAIKFYRMTDSTFSIQGFPADALAVGQNMTPKSDIHPIKLGYPYTMTSGKYVNYSTGALDTTTYGSYSQYIDIGNATRIIYTRARRKSSSSNAGIAFYNSSKTFISGSGSRDILSAPSNYVDLESIAVPANAKYCRFSGFPDGDHEYAVYDESQYYNALETKALWGEANRMMLHEMPLTKGQLNIVKRCRQMTEIKWTPAVDLPRVMLSGGTYWQGIFKKGVEYKGVPYGRSNSTQTEKYGYDPLFVGIAIPFETFVTSAQCKDSIVCKESVGDISNNESTVYSAVCSGFTSYVLGLTTWYPSNAIASIPGLASIGKIDNNGTLLAAKNFRIADVLNLANDHTAVITDIVRDESGEITNIEVSEETSTGEPIKNEDGMIGGVAIRKAYTLAGFYSHWGAYTLYRYRFAKNVSYNPSSYVNVGGEVDMFKYDHLPCMPYEGNAFTYKTGKIPNNAVKVLVEDAENGYTHMRVFRDGTEITGSPFAISGSTEYVNVTEISSGDYTAYLCVMEGGTNVRQSTSSKWSIASA